MEEQFFKYANPTTMQAAINELGSYYNEMRDAYFAFLKELVNQIGEQGTSREFQDAFDEFEAAIGTVAISLSCVANNLNDGCRYLVTEDRYVRQEASLPKA